MIIRLVTLIVLSAIGGNTFSQSIEKLIFNTQHWEKFNWDQVRDSLIWSSAAFKEYKTESTTEHEKFKINKNYTTTIDGIKFIISHGEYKRTNHQNFLFANIADGKFEDCQRELVKVSKVFGAASTPIDSSYKLMGDMKIKLIDYQWIHGQTTITMTCSSFGSKENPIDDINFTFEKTSELSKINPTISIFCERKYRSINKTDWNPTSSLVLKIIPKEEVIADIEGKYWGKTYFLSDAQIKFTTPVNNLEIKYTIDRVSGNLSASVYPKDSTNPNAIIQGECKPYNASERKF